MKKKILIKIMPLLTSTPQQKTKTYTTVWTDTTILVEFTIIATLTSTNNCQKYK